MTKNSKKQKIKEKILLLRRWIGNLFRQLIVCLFAIGICAGSILAGLGLGYIFFDSKTGSTIFAISPILIIPYIIAEFLSIAAIFGLIMCLMLGVILFWEGLTDWESIWIWSEKSKKQAQVTEEREEAEERQHKQQLASLVIPVNQKYIEINHPRFLSTYITDGLKRNEPVNIFSREKTQEFEVFFRKKLWASEVYSDFDEGGWSDAENRLENAITKIVAEQQPVKPKLTRLQKLFGANKEKLETLLANDYIKVAEIRTYDAAEALLQLRKISNELQTAIKLLGTDHGAIHLGDVIKTPDSKYLMIDDDGFHQINLSKKPGEYLSKDFTYKIEYFIQISNDIVILKTYNKSKTEPQLSDIGNFIYKMDPKNDYRSDFYPKNLPIPYRITKLNQQNIQPQVTSMKNQSPNQNKNGHKKQIAAIALVLMLLLTGIGWSMVANSQQTKKIYGLDFGPYVKDGQQPGSETISQQQIRDLMTIIKPYTQWVRTYSCTNGLEFAGEIAHQLGLKIAVSAWLSTNLTANQIEITELITIAQKHQADLLIVGSETLLRRDLNESQLISYINQVKTAIKDIPVATADAQSSFIAHRAIINASDLILLNIYPFLDDTNISLAVSDINNEYERLQNIAGTKQIIISETGWPSAGDQTGNAVASPQNSQYFFLNFISWAKSKNAAYFYFEAFDEPWKAKDEGSKGANWGIWDKNLNIKPAMMDIFNGKTIDDNWSDNEIINGAGTPTINFTNVPAIGSRDILYGNVSHINAKNCRVAVYIKVEGKWWTKPTYDTPTVTIQRDGTWLCNIGTAETDLRATEIAAYLVNATYTPPLMNSQNNALPQELQQNSIANIHQNRT
jgi:exo-beta-1,3-glucanase (GH17 family)